MIHAVVGMGLKPIPRLAFLFSSYIVSSNNYWRIFLEIYIINKGTGFSEISVDKIKKLAVNTNLNSKIYKQISRQELLSEPGIFIEKDKANKWECTESLEYEGKLLFHGPLYNGKTLSDIDMNIEILLNLSKAYHIILKENLPVNDFYSPGIFIPESGGILFFPPILINYITSQLSENEGLKFLQPYNHPDAKSEAQFSFILGVLAYKLLTNTLPFTGTSITEIREKMRSSQPVGIDLLVPGIKKNIAALINRALSLKAVKLKDWTDILQVWQKESAVNEINEEERLKLQKAAAIIQNKRENLFKRRQFFSRNWKVMAIIAAVFVFIVSFTIQPIRNAMEPPITAGMSAEEVVGTYYSGIIDMDVEIMEDCVKKGAGKGDINEVTQLFVISKVRSGYEGKSGLISAQDWNDGVITTINPGEQVYGIANLNITQSDSYVFIAEYIRWYPNIPEDTNPNEILPPIKVNITDTLTLEKVKDIWRIISLERKTMAGRQ